MYGVSVVAIQFERCCRNSCCSTSDRNDSSGFCNGNNLRCIDNCKIDIGAACRQACTSDNAGLTNSPTALTSAGKRASSSAAATPLRAAPTTTTCRPSTEKCCVPTPSPQLQRRQAEERKDDRNDEKTGDDLRLAPADQLEVVKIGRAHV